jgi:hypothetical protein
MALEESTLVPEDLSRSVTLSDRSGDIDAEAVLPLLRDDLAVFVTDATPERADEIMLSVATSVGLAQQLPHHAEFATSVGRANVGKYFMTVSGRNDYQFVPPHTEGSSLIGVQLASFYCYENSTDGGETILFNNAELSPAWPNLRERVRRGRFTGTPSKADTVRARVLYKVSWPEDDLHDDDTLISQVESRIAGFEVFDVLAPLRPKHSVILGRDVFSYWFDVAAVDVDSGLDFDNMLRVERLLREPTNQSWTVAEADCVWRHRFVSSGVTLADLFRCKITRKLRDGELVIVNNLTWAHAANNWTPGTGERRVVAAFA